MNDHGSVTVEYVTILLLVAVTVSLAMVAAGQPLVRQFIEQTAWISLGYP